MDDEFSSTNVFHCLLGEFIRTKCRGQSSDHMTDHKNSIQSNKHILKLND